MEGSMFSVRAKEFIPGAVPVGPLKDRVCMAFYEFAECPYGAHCEHGHHFAELNAATQAKLLGAVPLNSIPAHFVASLGSPKSLKGTASSTPTSFTAYASFQHRHEHSISSKTDSHGHGGPTLRKQQPCTPTLRAYRQQHHSGSRSLLDTSVSSHASSSGASHSGISSGYRAYGDSTASALSGMVKSRGVTGKASTLSPTLAVTSAAAAAAASTTDAAALDGSFTMHLPARCRYPHRSLRGSYYDVLSVTRNATHEEVMEKYRLWRKDGFKHMRLVDPSRAELVDRLVVEARNVLGNPVLREEYDRVMDEVDSAIRGSAADVAMTATAAATAASFLPPSLSAWDAFDPTATSKAFNYTNRSSFSPMQTQGCSSAHSSSSSASDHASGAEGSGMRSAGVSAAFSVGGLCAISAGADSIW